MQQLSDQDVHAAHVAVRPRKRKTSARRKITVRLSEGVCGRLDVATDRPGVGKSMFVEAALEQFLNPALSVEALVHERFDQMHARFDRLEHDMRIMAETVALHARYQLAVTPPVPHERQRDAILLGDERFKVLAEQVDRRVRQHRPLMQETIERLNSKGNEPTGEATSEQPPRDPESRENRRQAASEDVEITQASQPAAGMVGRNSHAQRRPIYSVDPPDGSRSAERDRSPARPKSRPTSSEEGEVSTKPSHSNWRLIFSVFLLSLRAISFPSSFARSMLQSRRHWLPISGSVQLKRVCSRRFISLSLLVPRFRSACFWIVTVRGESKACCW